jgi:hypothetical protein
MAVFGLGKSLKLTVAAVMFELHAHYSDILITIFNTPDLPTSVSFCRV